MLVFAYEVNLVLVKVYQHFQIEYILHWLHKRYGVSTSGCFFPPGLEVLSPSGVGLSPFTWMGIRHQLTSYTAPNNVNSFSYHFYQEVAY